MVNYWLTDSYDKKQHNLIMYQYKLSLQIL